MQGSCSWPVATSYLQVTAVKQLLLQAALEEGNISAVQHPEVHAEAEHEVLALVGLPGLPCLRKCYGL